MGAWGSGIFENDSALDWVGDLVGEDSFDLIYNTLGEAVKFKEKSEKGNIDEDEILEEPLGSEVLTAIGVVAAIKGVKFDDLPSILEDWLKEGLVIDEDTVSMAKEALIIVKKKSELRELWEEGTFDEWIQVLDELYKKLEILRVI